MKRIIIITACILCTVHSVKAQFSLGAKAAINFSRINTDNFNESAVNGYQAGLWARFGTGFFIQPEVYLGSSGGKFNITDNGVGYNASTRFTTLNAPLLLGKSYGGDNLNIHLVAGPVYTYILDKNVSLSNNFNQAYHDFGNYRNSTLGYQVGGGLDLGHITMDLHYEGALTKINENYGQRQRLWSLILGYKFF